MEVNVVIKWNDRVKARVLAEPSDCISTNRKENEGHVEFQGLSCTFSRGKTITHHFKPRPTPVLNKFPCK